MVSGSGFRLNWNHGGFGLTCWKGASVEVMSCRALMPTAKPMLLLEQEGRLVDKILSRKKESQSGHIPCLEADGT